MRRYRFINMPQACVKEGYYAFLHLNKYSPTSFQKNKYNKMPSEISKYRAKATENIEKVKWKNKRLREWVLSNFFLTGGTGEQETQKTQEFEEKYD